MMAVSISAFSLWNGGRTGTLAGPVRELVTAGATFNDSIDKH
jgi:hypothetical protein